MWVLVPFEGSLLGCSKMTHACGWACMFICMDTEHVLASSVKSHVADKVAVRVDVMALLWYPSTSKEHYDGAAHRTKFMDKNFLPAPARSLRQPQAQDVIALGNLHSVAYLRCGQHLPAQK